MSMGMKPAHRTQRLKIADSSSSHSEVNGNYLIGFIRFNI